MYIGKGEGIVKDRDLHTFQIIHMTV